MMLGRMLALEIWKSCTLLEPLSFRVWFDFLRCDWAEDPYREDWSKRQGLTLLPRRTWAQQMASPSQGFMDPSWVTLALPHRKGLRGTQLLSFVMSGVARWSPNTITHPYLLLKNTFTWKGPTWIHENYLTHVVCCSYFCNFGWLLFLVTWQRTKGTSSKGQQNAFLAS